MADAGEVRDGVERGGLLDAHDEVVRQLAGGAAGAVGDADKGGLEGLQFADGLVQRLEASAVFGGKNSNENVGRWCFEDVGDVHERMCKNRPHSTSNADQMQALLPPPAWLRSRDHIPHHVPMHVGQAEIRGRHSGR